MQFIYPYSDEKPVDDVNIFYDWTVLSPSVFDFCLFCLFVWDNHSNYHSLIYVDDNTTAKNFFHNSFRLANVTEYIRFEPRKPL